MSVRGLDRAQKPLYHFTLDSMSSLWLTKWLPATADKSTKTQWHPPCQNYFRKTAKVNVLPLGWGDCGAKVMARWQEIQNFRSPSPEKRLFFLPVTLSIWQDLLLGINLSLSFCPSRSFTHKYTHLVPSFLSQHDSKIWLLSPLSTLIFSLHASNK